VAIDDALHLKPMTHKQLNKAQNVLREAHSRAYGWKAPKLPIDFQSKNPMRLYVRRWINEWDLRRLYGDDAQVDFEDEHLTVNLGEDDNFQEMAWEEGTD
jgi:hypothetical protein